jgi:hypothetical protein
MNDLENYKAILENHFGAGSATFNTTTGTTNLIIGALNHTQFVPFRTAFGKRLERLNALYSISDSNRKNLIDRANDIATANNWDGAYAELVAFDFLNSNLDYSSLINLSKTVPASATLAGGLGMSNVNLDGYYDDFDVWFDVKALGDKSRDILDGIIRDAKKNLGIPTVVISPEYPLDLDYELFQKHRRALLAELENGINVAAQTTYFKSTVIPELAFRLMLQGGVLAAISTYDPYGHAENHHKLLFTYAKKFSLTSPTLIVSVIFPWFSESVVQHTDSSEIFYRSLCRRFFCQYVKDSSPAKTILTKFQGNESLSQVTDKLSGVLFLEDTSLTSIDSAAQNVKAYAYFNPNAAHKVSRHFRDYLSSLRFFVDDFAHDNY